MQEIMGIAILSVLAIVSTYGFSRGLWLLGVQGKQKNFKKLWLAVSCFFTSIITAVGFVALVIKL